MEFNQHIDQSVNHLFRQESGKMVAVLVKIFGTEHLELAEDVVQEALISALKVWRFRGLPDNPRAWLYQVAKNKAIDIIRKQKHFQSFDFTDPSHQLLNSEYTLVNTMNSFWQETHIQDDFLGMMYACCNPDISPENQITLILKALCGFSTKEVAKAFLTTDDTVSKRLYRTKEYYRKHKTRPQIPGPEEIPTRTSGVLAAIYLLFNEGYNSTHSAQLIRKDLISQAMSLCQSLLNHTKTRLPEVYALMSLMCFHAARSDSRTTHEGALIMMAQQDRSRWNKHLITLGNEYLNKAAFGNLVSTYHLEAAIAYEYCMAPDYERTNWKNILEFYDTMLASNFNPIVFLNRCIVLMKIAGPSIAYDQLMTIKQNKPLEKYYLYHATLGELFESLGRNQAAIDSYQNAIMLTQSLPEQRFLRTKIVAIKT